MVSTAIAFTALAATVSPFAQQDVLSLTKTATDDSAWLASLSSAPTRFSVEKADGKRVHAKVVIFNTETLSPLTRMDFGKEQTFQSAALIRDPALISEFHYQIPVKRAAKGDRPEVQVAKVVEIDETTTASVKVEPPKLLAQKIDKEEEGQPFDLLPTVKITQATTIKLDAIEEARTGYAAQPKEQGTREIFKAILGEENAQEEQAKIPSEAIEQEQLASSLPIPKIKPEVVESAEPIPQKPKKKQHFWAKFKLPSSTFKKSQQRCLAAGIYFESRGEPEEGQAAVAQVILNRVKNPTYPNTICGVVYQNKHKRNRCQFSFACDGIYDRIKDKKSWERAVNIARDVSKGKIYLEKVGDSTHYHATYVNPRWARTMKVVDRIGIHIFYRTKRGGWS